MSKTIQGYVLFIFIIAVVGGVISFIVYMIYPPSITVCSAEACQLCEAMNHSISFSAKWITYGFVISLFFLRELKSAKIKLSDAGHFIKCSIRKVSRKPWLAIYVISLTFVSLPWIFASIGIFISDIIPFSYIFLARQLINNCPAVHIGFHHGLTGYILCMIMPPFLYFISNKVEMKQRNKTIVAFCSWLFIFYGLYLVIEDFLNEQIYKRGIPIKLPAFDLTTAWLVIVFLVLATISTYLQYKLVNKSRI